jgi:hypothetical protein
MFILRHMPIFRFVLFVWALLFAMSSSAQSIPDDNTMAMIRANYLYQFASNSNWPSEWKKGTFNAAIVGNPEVFEIMVSKYAGKPIGSQALNVIGATEMAVTPQVHVLFIDRSKKAELAKYVKEFKGKSTLIVTNWEGALAQGAHVNFLSIDGSIRFELNKTAMTEAVITPGIKILQWAIE